MRQLVENSNSLRPELAATERMEQARSFWKQQVHTRGRTGWADPVVYAYDQLDRLERIKKEISSRPVKSGKALDFGCGPGDFSKLLLSLGFSVCGYDPFVRPEIRSRAFSYAKSYDEINCRGHKADLALSITTLDHILYDGDLRLALQMIRDCLRQGADFYMIEYALDSEDDREKFRMKSGHQSFHSLAYWNVLLTQSSFRVLSVNPVSHPFISPSSGYLPYVRSSVVRLVKRYPGLRVTRMSRDRLLRWQASRLIPKSTGAELNGGSPLKLIHCSTV